MPPKKWVHPMADDSVDKEYFKHQDMLDPRALHKGPCGGEHAVATLEDMPRTAKTVFNANKFSRWADCNTCGLRLGFWPKQGHTGKYTKQVHPKVVEEALKRVAQAGRWDTCTKKLMDGLIQTIEGEIKVSSSAPATPRQRVRPEARTTSSPPGPSCQRSRGAANKAGTSRAPEGQTTGAEGHAAERSHGPRSRGPMVPRSRGPTEAADDTLAEQGAGTTP